MATSIFVNLAVDDLEKSRDFFSALGYGFNPQFSDENAACLVISDTIYFMLLTKEHFSTFTGKPIVDSRTATEAILSLSADSREAVDALADKALAAGAGTVREPDDYGFMYQRSFTDPDGHQWEILWMDPTHVE